MVTYRIKTVVTATGERLPMLLGRDGAPVWGATLFTLTELRARNRSSSTIENALHALIVLQLFSEQRDIDLQKRVAVGALFRLDEVEDLVRICRLSLADIRQGSISTAEAIECRKATALRLSTIHYAKGREFEAVASSTSSRVNSQTFVLEPKMQSMVTSGFLCRTHAG